MEDEIRIADDRRGEVAKLLQDILWIDPKTAQDIVADGKIDKFELANKVDPIGIFSSARELTATPVAQYFNKQFFESAGLNRDFFVDLYGATFNKSANKAGPSDVAIDSKEDIAKLEETLKEFVQQRKPDLESAVLERMEKWAKALVHKDHISVDTTKKSIEGKQLTIFQVHIGNTEKKAGSRPTLDVPVNIELLKHLFYDEATTNLPIAAKELFAKNETAKGNITLTEIKIPWPLPNQLAHVRMTLENTNVGGQKGYIIHMDQLDSQQEVKEGLAPITDHRMGYLKGTLTLTDLGNGLTRIVFDVDGNPDFPFPDVAVKGSFADTLYEASGSIAVYMVKKAYFQKCLQERSAGCKK